MLPGPPSEYYLHSAATIHISAYTSKFVVEVCLITSLRVLVLLSLFSTCLGESGGLLQYYSPSQFRPVAPASEDEPSAAGPAYAVGPGQLAESAYAAGPGQLAEPAYAAGPGQLAETSYQGGSVGPDASVYSDGDALDSYGAPLGMFIDH